MRRETTNQVPNAIHYVPYTFFLQVIQVTLVYPVELLLLLYFYYYERNVNLSSVYVLVLCPRTPLQCMR